MVDVVAVDTQDLLTQIDGLQVQVLDRPHVLHTAGAVVQEFELSWVDRILLFLSDPAVAAILLSLGMLGLIIELRTPGFGVPGISGAVLLLLAFYALGQLDANFAGLALLLVALAFFVAEAFTPTFGVLAGGGIVAFIAGGALLFNGTGMHIPWFTIIAVAIILGAVTLIVGAKALAAQRRPAITGAEGLIGQVAVAKANFGPGQSGAVFVLGEWWNAEVESGDLQAGQSATIISSRGYTLIVHPLPMSTQPETMNA